MYAQVSSIYFWAFGKFNGNVSSNAIIQQLCSNGTKIRQLRR